MNIKATKNGPYMKHFKCTIHNIEYSAEDLPQNHEDDKGYIDCPYCSVVLVKELRRRLEEAKQHKKILLEAIELKKTQIDISGSVPDS